MNRAWLLYVGLAAGLTGCLGGSNKAEKVQGRSQMAEDPAADPDAFAAVGQKTTVGNTEPIPVSGVGLVYNLQPGTGSAPPQGLWRQMLERSLQKQGVSNVKSILDNPARTSSLVIVTALVPPGARRGDPVDVVIALPDESKTTSLKGGVLWGCELGTSDTTGNLKSLAQTGAPGGPGGTLLTGDTWATAQGPVVAGTVEKPGQADGVDSETAAPRYKAGRVWGGGRLTRTRPYYFLMNPGDQNVRMAATVADRLVSTFSGSDPSTKVAEAKTRELVLVNVPPAYRHNHYRYLLVAREVPVVPVAADSVHRRMLEEKLLDPATTVKTAIQLEALGGDSHRQLRLGLRSPSPWVRFAAAEALAYLGQTDGAEELAKLAEDHPAVRAQCLKALASIDDGVSTERLVELMANPDPALRYGAFLALRLCDDKHPAAGGALLNNAFWLHRVAPGSPGLVHLTTGRRSEVVVFGDGVRLRGPLTLPVGGGFAVTVSATEPEVKVSRVVQGKDEAEVKELKCRPDLPEVLATLVKLGGGHAEAVDLIRRADSAQHLSAAVAVDALPREMSAAQLASFARSDPTLAKANVEVAKVGVVAPAVEQAGYDVPADPEAEAKGVEPAAYRPPLSRDPGRIFGPKRPPEPAGDVVPAALGPPEPAKPAAVEASRNPGTLFNRKK